jgi:predicted Fe-S protein YdhL (DUF1289 family)
MERQFINLCKYGNLEGAKEFLRLHSDINISIKDDKAFRYSCKNGHLEVAKWLLQMKPDINNSLLDDYIFCDACFYGHLEVAKWLLSVKPDINISAKDDEAFYWACKCGYLDIAKWLQTLKPYLYVIEYNKNGKCIGYKIRSKEEANWKKRKIALHLALQEENNILYHLPIDISKTVALFL